MELTGLIGMGLLGLIAGFVLGWLGCSVMATDRALEPPKPTGMDAPYKIELLPDVNPRPLYPVAKYKDDLLTTKLWDGDEDMEMAVWDRSKFEPDMRRRLRIIQRRERWPEGASGLGFDNEGA